MAIYRQLQNNSGFRNHHSFYRQLNFCLKMFKYLNASAEIKEVLWFCSHKCREEYWKKHHEQEEKYMCVWE